MAPEQMHDNLTEQLASDALPLTPTFSESLHAQTMRAIKQQHVRRVLSRPANQWWRIGLAAAASLLVAVTLWWIDSYPQVLDRIPTVALNTGSSPATIGAPDPHALFGSGSEPLRNALTEVSPPMNDWSEDAHSLVRYIKQQFPSAPPAAPADAKRM